MTKADMDRAIRAAMHAAGWHPNFIVSKTEQIAFIAGMRAAADLAEPIYDQDPNRAIHTGRMIAAKIRAAADELEKS
jgi:hypothetical protein